MTAPRQILEGTTYLVTRRCAQRQLLLSPSELVNEVFLYVLAVAAARFGILVHAYCVLSNHFHLVVTDPEARLPAFHQFLDGLVARALNAAHGRWEAFWAPNSYSAVALTTPSDIVDKAAYTLSNPVLAGLVRSARQWPGLWSAPERIGGQPIAVRRPDHFFDPDGTLPDEATLQLAPPRGFASISDFHEQLTAALAVLEAEAVRERRGGFLGSARVLAQRPTSRPASIEPRRTMKPRVAARDKWKRIEALGRVVEFVAAYRAAWLARRSGKSRVIFPSGTYQLRVVHGVPCAAPG